MLVRPLARSRRAPTSSIWVVDACISVSAATLSPPTSAAMPRARSRHAPATPSVDHASRSSSTRSSRRRA